MPPRSPALLSTRLQHFLLVTELGSIRKAAARLMLAPSSVSRTISQLEHDFGTAIFERVGNTLSLTGAGLVLLDHARASALELDQAASLIEDMKGLRAGKVSVAVVESVARGILPDALASFWSKARDVEVAVKVLGSKQALDSMRQGDCDLAVAFDIPGVATGECLCSVSLPIGAVMTPDHPLASRKFIEISDLSRERVLYPDEELTIGLPLQDLQEQISTNLHRRLVTNSIAVMADMAARGEGIAFQTRIGVERELLQGTLVFVPLHQSRLSSRRLGVFTRSSVVMPAAPRTLAAELGDALRRLSLPRLDVADSATY